MSNSRFWMQVTSGRGPVECQLAVMKVADKIVQEAVSSGMKAEVIEMQKGEVKGTALSVLVGISGNQPDVFIRQWAGSVLWICQSPYRKHHKRKNWFVGVEALKPLEREDIVVDPRDISIEVFRASGPGGQHVNTTDSAVRIKHKPSGLSVVSSAERSQIMNRKLAMVRLVNKLSEEQDSKEKDGKRELWEKHNNLQRGDAVRVFEGDRFRERN